MNHKTQDTKNMLCGWCNMRKNYVMIIKNLLDGSQVKIENAQDLSTEDKNNIIKGYTSKWTDNCIGYYISYLYEQ